MSNPFEKLVQTLEGGSTMSDEVKVAEELAAALGLVPFDKPALPSEMALEEAGLLFRTMMETKEFEELLENLRVKKITLKEYQVGYRKILRKVTLERYYRSS